MPSKKTKVRPTAKAPPYDTTEIATGDAAEVDRKNGDTARIVEKDHDFEGWKGCVALRKSGWLRVTFNDGQYTNFRIKGGVYVGIKRVVAVADTDAEPPIFDVDPTGENAPDATEPSAPSPSEPPPSSARSRKPLRTNTLPVPLPALYKLSEITTQLFENVSMSTKSLAASRFPFFRRPRATTRRPTMAVL